MTDSAWMTTGEVADMPGVKQHSVHLAIDRGTLHRARHIRGGADFTPTWLTVRAGVRV